MRSMTRLRSAVLAALALSFFSLLSQSAQTLNDPKAVPQISSNLTDSSAIQDAPSVPSATPVRAAITGVSTGGVGFATYQQTGGVVTGNIGRWDAPYPGHEDPDLEPVGYSYLYIDVDVHDGGLVNFEYILNTYDAGIWDWLDVSLETPTENIILVNHLGKPGNTYGIYWQSSLVNLTQRLDAWKNQHVRFVFAVRQDGWGDQTMADLRRFEIAACPVTPLQPLPSDDPVAQQFEDGNVVDETNLTPEMQTALANFKNAIVAAGGHVVEDTSGRTGLVKSAYRPPAYQLHLKEVFDKWQLLKNISQPECAAIRTQVQNEFNRHGLGASSISPAGPAGFHPRGLAVDLNINSTGLQAQTVLDLANQNGLYRPARTVANDPVHFELRPPPNIMSPFLPVAEDIEVEKLQRNAGSWHEDASSNALVTLPVAVKVSQESVGGKEIYYYRVTNNSPQSIVGINIGYDYYHGVSELKGVPLGWDFYRGIPSSSASSPAGWRVKVITTEESEYSKLEWVISAPTGKILPGKSSGGFIAVLPQADDLYKTAHWTAILSDGTIVSAPLEVEALPKYAVSGAVKLGTAGLSGVTLKLTSPTPVGFTPRTFTTSNGSFSFSNLPAGRTYIITPTKVGYSFTPMSRTYSNISANQPTTNFAAARSYSISGKVTRTGTTTGIAGVTMTITSPTPAGFTARTAQTNSTGNYTFAGLPASRNYTIKPTKTGYTFNPLMRSITNLSNNVPVGASTSFTGRQ
jgi:hypothetical protein